MDQKTTAVPALDHSADHEAALPAATAPQGDSPKKKQAALAAGSLVISKMLTESQAAAAIKKQTNTKIHAEYDGIMNKANSAGDRFRAALPGVVAFINKSLTNAGIHAQVTTAELATNFLAEGGDQVIAANRVDKIDGYQDVGIDTFMSQFEELKSYLPADLIAFAMKKVNQESNTNELGQRVTTIKNMDMEQAMQANAAMYAQAIAHLTVDLQELKPPVDIDTLPEQARMFWATLYFNAGFGTGKKDLVAKGVNWWKTAWKRGGKNAHLFALERMGSEELLAHDEEAEPSDGPIPS